MREEFNKKVFESLPDSVYTGEMPSLGTQTPRRDYRLLAVAMSVVAVAFAVSTTILATRHHVQEPAPQAEMLAKAEIVYTVNNALQGEIVLPDSTMVTLNSGSSLRLAGDFGTGTRTVYLDGEAYFDVHKDKAVPFLIKTPQDVLVTVTGTRFNLKCFSDNPKFDLTLIQGSVNVTTASNEVLNVRPSEEIIINNNFHNISTVDTPSDALVWTKGILKFDSTPMTEAIRQIERWYGVKVEVTDDKVYRGSFTAEFKSETLTEVLDLLCLTSRLEYSYDADESSVRLKPNTL